MGKYAGIMLSSAGTSVVVFVSLYQIVPSSTNHWSSVVGLGFLALICGLLVNAVALVDLHRSSNQKAVAEREYRNLYMRLPPLLLHGMNELFERSSVSLRTMMAEYLDCNRDLELYAFLKIDDIYRIVASSEDRISLTLRIALDHTEGVVGFTHDRKTPVIAQFDPLGAGGQAFNRRGDSIGEQYSLRNGNLERCRRELKWIYAEPIIHCPPEMPWFNSIIGILTVDSYDESGKDAFLQEDFQNFVRRLSQDIAPYLLALEALNVDKNASVTNAARKTQI